MPSIQKKIRDLERVIKRKSSNGTNENSEEIAQLKNRLEELHGAQQTIANDDHNKKLAIKYRMVKFIERKKLTRKIRAVDNKLKGNLNDKDRSNLEASRADLEDDLTYVLYYPRSLKYVALFADNADEKSTRKAAVGDATQQETCIRMREMARKEREEGIAAGASDRVQHAINVEYGLETEDYVAGADAPHKTKPVRSVTAPLESFARKTAAKKTHALPKQSEASVSDGLTVENGGGKAVLEAVSEREPEKEALSSGWVDADADSSDSDSDSDSSSSSSSNSSSSSSDSDSDSDSVSNANDDESALESVNTDNKKQASVDAEEDDDFFLEGDKGSNSKHDSSKIQSHEDVVREARAKGHFKAGRTSGRNQMKSGNGYGRRGSTAPGQPMHKQEARRLKWQDSRKDKIFVPTLASTLARPRKREGVESSRSPAGGVGGGDGSTEAGSGARARKRRAEQIETSSNGVKTSRRYERAQDSKNDTKNDKNDKKSLWERSGGISARSVTAATIQRNKGSISTASQGKKITFDD